MLDHQRAAPKNPTVPVSVIPPGNLTQVNGAKQSWLAARGGGRGGGNKIDGFTVYLSNIPEKAQSANLLGALRKLLGPFRPRNLLRIHYGICKVVLEDKKTRDRLLNEPFDIFGTIIKTTLEPPNPGEAWPSVYIAGLPPQTTVGQLLGAIRKTIGEFQASNKLVITNGCAMIRFKNEQQQMSLLTAGLSICSIPVLLSKHPFSRVGSVLDACDGLKRGFGQFLHHPGGLMSGRSLSAGFNGQGAQAMHIGVLRQEQPLLSMSVDALELINKRLKSRVRYLEQQIAMYEDRFAKLQAPIPGAAWVDVYNPQIMW